MNLGNREVSNLGKRGKLRSVLLHSVGGFATVASLVCAHPASAQAQTAVEGAETVQLDEIVVTAEKRSTNAQDVSIAISVLSSDSLDRSGVDSTLALQSSSPSLVVGSFGGFGQPYVRGIGNELLTLASDSSTSVYMDGVYLARPGGTLQQFLDVDRVEILRGPQGTLYGRNSVGGSINIHSVAPTDENTGSADVSYGNFNKFRARAAVNVPLIDGKLFARFAGIRSSSRGYVTNLTPPGSFSAVDGVGSVSQHYGGDDLIGGRASFRFVPDEKWDIQLSFDAARDRGTQTSTNKLLTSLPSPALPAGRTDPSPFKNYLNFSPVEKKDQWGSRLAINYDLGAATVKSITSFRHNLQDVFFDVDATDVDLNHERLYSTSDTWTQEINVVSSGDGPLEWVVGAYYLKDDALQDIPLFLNSGDFLLDFRGTLDTWAWATFGQASYRIGDIVRITGGLRYSQEQKTISVDHNAVIGGNPVNLLLVPEDSRKWSSWTPKVGVDIFIADHAMIYGSVSKGYKSGGFNLLSLDPSTFSFNPENLWSYEVGLKSELFDRRLRLNLSAFWYDHKDRQEQVASAFGAVTANAASATIKGIEIETVALLAPGFELNASYSYLDGRYDQYLTVDPDRPELGTLDLGALGNRVPRAPKHSAVVSATYNHEFASAGKLTLFAEYSWKSRIYHNVYNEEALSQASFGLLNGRVTYQPDGSDWRISAWGKNLTDKVWFQTGIRNTAFFGSFENVAEPRTYGIEVGYKW